MTFANELCEMLDRLARAIDRVPTAPEAARARVHRALRDARGLVGDALVICAQAEATAPASDRLVRCPMCTRTTRTLLPDPMGGSAICEDCANERGSAAKARGGGEPC